MQCLKLITFAGDSSSTLVSMRQRLCLLRLSCILRMRKYFQLTSARVEPGSAKSIPNAEVHEESPIKINRIGATGAGLSSG